ncbi:helix-turn-helix transcriptional regulator [Polymorphospora sp. 2-325]|uniref:Helix-turn-helix transcriptional regulator n=1 Tax=Polymorphospora lycopeni TaxID=3140240 RepID=A0ABV5CYU6_9ACTN
MALLRWAIGTVLRRTRHAQGRILREVAAAAGVSVQYLSEVERGRKEASSEILAGICRALDLPLVDLLEEVRAELLRGGRGAAGPRVRLLAAGHGSAVGRSASGRTTGVRVRRSRTLVTCSSPRRRTTPSFSTSS